MTDTITLPRSAAEALRSMLAEKGLRVDVLDAALAERVPWRKAEAMVTQMRGYLPPSDIGSVDQAGAELINRYAAIGVDIRDERNLFVALATIALVSQAADNAARIGAIDTDGHRAALVPLRSAGVVLAVLAPVHEDR